MQLTAQAGVKRLLVQILVVVANIQMRTLKIEVGRVPREQRLDVG